MTDPQIPPCGAPVVAPADPGPVSTHGLTAFALGSNVGDSRAVLAWAARQLEQHFGPLWVAPLYRTEPISAIVQDPFLNTVLVGPLNRAISHLGADGSPLERTVRRVVGVAKELEAIAGRRPGPKDGPRPLDVDLLFWGEHGGRFAARDAAAGSLGRQEWPGAVDIPHPRMTVRRFVLAPLADLLPSLRLTHDGRSLPIGELLAACADQGAARVSWAGPDSL